MPSYQKFRREFGLESKENDYYYYWELVSQKSEEKKMKSKRERDRDMMIIYEY